jgi:L,D-transpeptidase catalytic domain
MTQRSILRAVFAAVLLAVAAGANAQGFGSVSSGVRLPDATTPGVAETAVATPAVAQPAVATPAVVEPAQGSAVGSAAPAAAAATVPGSTAIPPAGSTAAGSGVVEPSGSTADANGPFGAAAAGVTEPFGTTAAASGPFGAAVAGIESLRAGYEPADTILVRKGERRMYLMRANRIVAEYPIRLGLNPSGHKEREGDFRTPEGLYELVRRNPRSEYFLSLEVSYPNDADRARAKKIGVPPGGLIMIHGQPNLPRKSPEYYEKFDWTNGCIAVSNSDMVDIWLRTQLGTLVVIRP